MGGRGRGAIPAWARVIVPTGGCRWDTTPTRPSRPAHRASSGRSRARAKVIVRRGRAGPDRGVSSDAHPTDRLIAGYGRRDIPCLWSAVRQANGDVETAGRVGGG